MMFTPGEIMSFLGFVMTSAAIVWRGGTLAARLQTIERDVAALVRFQESAYTSISIATADRSAIRVGLSDVERRMGAMEHRCEECTKWRKGQGT